jgi:hypothetical protein
MGMNYIIQKAQMVRISINGTKIMTGICNFDEREKTYAKGINDGILMWKYTINSMKVALNKITCYVNYANSFYANIALALMPAELGISSGRVSTSESSTNTWENSGKTIAQTYDLIAKETGLAWWISPDLELFFCENESTIQEAPYNLDQDFGTNFEDYRNVVASGNYAEYANSIEVVGNEYEGMLIEGMQYAHEEHCDLLNICGYYAFSTKVISDNNYFYPPDNEHEMDTGSITGYVVDDSSDKPTIEEGDFVQNRSEDYQNFGFISTITINSTTSSRFYAYNMLASDGDSIYYYPTLNSVLKKEVNSKSAYPPEVLKFDTYTPGFLPRQRFYENLPDIGSEGYFLINQVQITDLTCNKFEFSITAEKKNYSNWITKSDKGYMSLFKNF